MRAVLLVTLLYVAVLVAVLAIGLILIAARLWGTARAIGEIRAALAQAEENTRALGGDIETINGALSSVSTGLASLHGHLRHADAALGRILARSGRSAA